jgi:outer membrane receptor for Fe3+-dicitrate
MIFHLTFLAILKYYNPPLEAVETIELVRGGASLQFGHNLEEW